MAAHSWDGESLEDIKESFSDRLAKDCCSCSLTTADKEEVSLEKCKENIDDILSLGFVTEELVSAIKEHPEYAIAFAPPFIAILS